MSRTRPHAATRKSVAALATMLMSSALPAFADGPPQLLLPLVTALAVASVASGPASDVVGSRNTERELMGLLPNQLRIPDGYEVEGYIRPHRRVVPLDADNYVSVDLLRRRRSGWMPSLSYDAETRGPLAGSSNLFSLVIEQRW